MTETLFEAQDLTIQYQTGAGPITAVSQASFSIEKGEYFGLVGESGCGKSTIAKAIVGGLDNNGEITSGQLLYKGEEIQDYSDQELNNMIRWNEISLIPQASMNSLDPLLRVKDQAIEIAQVHSEMTKEQTLDRLRNLFETVGLQPNRISDYPHQFSGGMQQRAVIAFALLLNPSMIIADEPTTALDVIMQDQIFMYLDKLKEEINSSMLLITHDISLVFEACDKISVMHAGQIAESGVVEKVYDNPNHPYAILLQKSFPDIRYPDEKLVSIEGNPPQNIGDVNYCTFVDRCPWAIEECRQYAPELDSVNEASNDHFAACIRKHEIDVSELPQKRGKSESTSDEKFTSRTSTLSDEPILEVKNLEKYFSHNTGFLNSIFSRDTSEIKAVDDVSFVVKNNESHGVIGESGCGKTTLLLTLIGVHEPTNGQILYKGKDVADFTKSDWKDFRSNVQIIFQNPFDSLDPRMTVRESLFEPLNVHNIDDREERVLKVLRDVELQPPEKYIDRLPKELSGGEKQRVAIARALILNPDLILADEPVSMLDVSTQADILNLLSNLMADYGVSMVYISHDLSTVSYICDDIRVMYLGRVVESSDTSDIIDDPKHPYTQSLLNSVPIPDPYLNRSKTVIEGSPPDPINLGEGCRFRDRCPERMDICDKTPRGVAVDGRDHVACHLYYEHDELVTGGIELE